MNKNLQAERGNNMADSVNISPEEFKEDVYDMMGLTVSAAKALLFSPQPYGPFRTIDQLSRWLTIFEKYNLTNDFMKEVRDYIEENKSLYSKDKEAFNAFLNELVIKVAKGSL
jgi:hypothetical protein